ncbi:hypothetical protein JMJ78_0000897 [Colletotrichum scovillei]|nr:hypothetical protein JMJ78_0000897 [Colletotrichum scovillei]
MLPAPNAADSKSCHMHGVSATGPFDGAWTDSKRLEPHYLPPSGRLAFHLPPAEPGHDGTDTITVPSSHPAQTMSSPSIDNSSNVVAAVKSAGKPTDAVMGAVSFPATGTSSNIITADNRV